MALRKSYILVALFVLLISTEAVLADVGENQGKGGEIAKGGDDDYKGKGNAKKGDDDEKKVKKEKEKKEKEKEKEKKEKEKEKEKARKEKEKKEKEKEKDKKKDKEEVAAMYRMLSTLPSGQQQAFCEAKGDCYYKTLVCPSQCPQRKPKKNKETKGCYIDCTNKCEATCKWRKPKCDGYGSLCYDPRFIGGDGVMFYFHGSKGGDFAIVSDDNLHINAHFIGSRPTGRTRDYTWVQALSIMFDTHNLVVAAKRVSIWDDSFDALIVRWNGEDVLIPNDEESEWKVNSEDREVIIERTDEKNSVRVTVSGIVQLDIKVRPIGKEENRVHNYQLPADDAFAHLETQFKFFNLSDQVEGVLGKTYRPYYVSPVKTGVPMPMMGGEDKYQTPSLFSPICKVCRFNKDQPGSAEM